MSDVRVVLVDDHALFRAGVRSELDGLVDVVGDAATVAEAVALSRDRARRRPARRPHARRRRAGGAPRRSAPRRPAAQFLALSVSDAARGRHRGHPRGRARLRDEDDLRRRPGRRRAPRARRRRRLLAAPRRLRARRLRRRRAGADGADDADLDQLTPREREVLQHIARGYMYKEIAQRLGHLGEDRRGARLARCCASCSSPAATSCRAGRRRGGWWIRSAVAPRSCERRRLDRIFEGCELAWCRRAVRVQRP